MVSKDQFVYLAGNQIMAYDTKTQMRKHFIDYDQENMVSFFIYYVFKYLPVYVTYSYSWMETTPLQRFIPLVHLPDYKKH